jgi:hypothetical protein
MKTFPLKLFTESGQYTEESSQLDIEVYQALFPILSKWVDAGYSPREIAHVMEHSVFDLELNEMMDILYNPDGTPREVKEVHHDVKKNDEQEKTTS